MKHRLRLLSILFFVLCIPVIYGQGTAKPRPGEGVNAFLARNKRLGNNYYDRFIELNKNKLGKNNSLLLDVSYIIPPVEENTSPEIPQKMKEPLFGEKLSEYTIESNRMKGACIFLVSEHGGPDPGAINGEMHEDEYAYDIMLRLALLLRKESATVHIIIQDTEDGIRDDKYLSNSTRETCMGDPIPLNQKERLNQRCEKINNLSSRSNEKYQRAIFIHLDSRSREQQVDVFFYYWDHSVRGKKLAETLKETIQSNYSKYQPNRGFKGTIGSRNLHVLRKSKPVGVLAELGNIQNSFDQKRFLDKNNRQALAKWLCEGFIKDYENSKTKN